MASSRSKRAATRDCRLSESVSSPEEEPVWSEQDVIETSSSALRVALSCHFMGFVSGQREERSVLQSTIDVDGFASQRRESKLCSASQCLIAPQRSMC